MSHEKILEAAFADPDNTPVILAPADVNKIIRTSYKADANFTYTKTQLWDMEIRKARNPEKYLPLVVRPGSLRLFNVKAEDAARETFIRVCEQRTWRDPSKFTTIIEDVFIDAPSMRIFFIGLPEFESPEGQKFVSGRDQPLFHVEHATTGSETAPLNLWRIVHLTKDEDGRLQEIFQPWRDSPYLQQFNEVYIREDLGQPLERI